MRRSSTPATAWPSIAAAQCGPATPRVPFVINGVAVGSIAVAHLPLLREHAQWLAIEDAAVTLRASAASRDAALAEMNAALRERGAIVAWRDEAYAVVDPAGGAQLATIERAAARFWGTLTFGAHATGYMVDAGGRPSHLWIAQRSPRKATDPGRLDNLIGGGVPQGQTPRETLLREGWEEAGLGTPTLREARSGRIIRLHREVAEGLQHEHLHSFDLCLPAGLVPANQDGEVAAFRLLPAREALALAAGRAMTVDASLVTLDFALRHGLLAPALHELLEPAAAGLWVSD